MKKLLISIVVLMIMFMTIGCKSMPPKLNQEFAAIDIDFIKPDLNDPDGHLSVDPVFTNRDFVNVYIQLVNVTMINDEISLVSMAEVVTDTGEVVFSETRVLDYIGPEQLEWYMPFSFSSFQFGHYVFIWTVIDIFGSSTIIETLEFEVVGQGI